MGISQRLAKAGERLAKEAGSKTGLWEEIMSGINKGIVIPMLSNSFRIDQIFRDQEDSGAEGKNVESENSLTISDQLTTEWANLIGYPMDDKGNLARVAQYYLVENKDSPFARTKYLESLKTFLLMLVKEGDREYAELAERLSGQIHELNFSEIVNQLDYPRFPEGVEDPLRLLARFQLPIYITTSQSDFLERALKAEGKEPRTQICFWSGSISSAKPEHKTDPDYVPTPGKPLVYHLYGLEDYPQTLVLSEDDYISFLMRMVEDTNTQNPIVPLYLRQALAESHLLMLGYRLQDWDFRILFRFVLKYRREDEFARRGMLIQLKPDGKRFEDVEKSLEYLGKYFDKRKFDIEWNNAEGFIRKLSKDWDIYRQKSL